MKSNVIKIGNGEAGDVELDISQLVSSRLLIQASSGGGKSYAIRRLIEQTHGKVQQIILDLEGDFGTLREHYDFILAGKGGDVAAEPKSAAMLARKLIELGVSAIIDLSELDHQNRKRFVRLFNESLIALPKNEWPSENGRSCLVVIDEAHVLCPERGQAESAESVNELASRGRKRGLCVVLATQRISKLRKDAVAECMNKLVGFTGYHDDRKRAGEELGFTGKDEVFSLRNLSPGEFMAIGPAISRDVVKVKVGEVITTHQKAGKRVAVKVVAPTAKMREVIGKLGDIPKEAEQEAATVADLQAQIRSLKAHRCPKVENDPQAIEKAVKAAVANERRRWSDLLIDWRGGMNVVTKTANDVLGRITAEEAVIRKTPSPKFEIPKQAPVPKLQITKVEHLNPDGGSEDVVIRGGAKRMLEVLASRYPIVLSKAQLGTLAKMKPSGGSFSTYLSQLRVAAFITEEGDGLKATDEGMAYLGASIPAPLSPQETQEMWRSNLSGGARRMFELLVEAYPNQMTKEELGEKAGVSPTGGSFSTYLSVLRTNGLVDVNRDGIKASETLFL